MKLKDKVAVVTGSGRGIGKAIALLFAKEGARVLVTDIIAKNAKATAKEISSKGGEAIAVTTDISKKSEISALIKKAVKAFGRLDILVNNAGIVRTTPLAKISEKEWDQIIDINLRGTFLCAQAAAKEMVKSKGGAIVNIASIAGIVGFEGLSHYCASKGGIIALTRELGLELSRSGIRVNAIGPGAIDTDMTKDIKRDKKALAGMLITIPMGRIGRPEEIAKAALFLASDDSSYMTGQTIFVDGGWTAR